MLDQQVRDILFRAAEQAQVARIGWEIKELESLWTDPINYPSGSYGSLGNSVLDEWMSFLSPESVDLLLRVKLLRNHMLATLVILDETSSRLQHLTNIEVLPDTVLKHLEEAGFVIPPGWWSLVGHDDELDEYDFRNGVLVQDEMKLFRVEGWRVADAVSGVTTGGASPYDEPHWLLELNASAFQGSRRESDNPWRETMGLLTTALDGVEVEINLHSEILEQVTTRGTTARSCLRHAGSLLGSLQVVFENLGTKTSYRTFSRPTGPYPTSTLPR